MGFNIAGLVINQNYDKDINKLSSDLKWGIEIIDEITFEEASSNWTPDGEFRLFFSDKSTMIFFPHDWVAEQNRSKTAETLNYAYSATAMAFQVDFFKSGKLVRSIFEYEGDRKMSRGEPLELETKNDTADGLTFALIDELLKGKFGEIDLGEKSYRCRKVQYIETDEKEIEKQKMKEALEKSPALRAILKEEMTKKTSEKSNIVNKNPKHEDSKSSVEKSNLSTPKKWWQFWK
jgi:hypothetical protein